jgi:ATPase subunit of ABC transporter with duplicated ATPase domains
MSQIIPVYASTFYFVQNDLVVSLQGRPGIGKSTLLTRLLQKDVPNENKTCLYICDDLTFFYEQDETIFATKHSIGDNTIEYRESLKLLKYEALDEQSYYKTHRGDKPLGLVIHLHNANSTVSKRQLDQYLTSEHNNREVLLQLPNSNQCWMDYLLRDKIPLIDFGILDKEIDDSVKEISELLLSHTD